MLDLLIGLALAVTPAAEATADRDDKFQCLSSWDGSHREFKRYVRQRVRNPRSFEHVETVVGDPAQGRQRIIMQFRAENGFGGMTDGIAGAYIRFPSCNLIESTVEIGS